jgi:hypothetical protein
VRAYPVRPANVASRARQRFTHA